MYRIQVTVETRLPAIRRIGRALADPTRSRVLLALLDGARFPSDLAAELGVSRQGVSNHLACLRDCGLVTAEPVGRRVRYDLADARLRHALTDLLGVLLLVDDECAAEGAADGRAAPSARGAVRDAAQDVARSATRDAARSAGRSPARESTRAAAR